MARIHPFAAVRPKPEYAKNIASPLFDTLNTEEARKLAKDNPYSFLWVDKAEIGLPEGVKAEDPAIYQTARKNFDKMIDGGILIRDDKPCFYIYRLTANGKSQTGLTACAETLAYERGEIVKHELILPEKMTDRIAHIKALKAQSSPVMLTYRDSGGKKSPASIMDNWAAKNAPLYDFEASGDSVRHTVWDVRDDTVITDIQNAFSEIEYLYIADGHHRSAAAHAAAKGEKGEASRYLTLIFPHNELNIMDYNRVVRDLNGMSPESFLEALKKDFSAVKSETPVLPRTSDVSGLYMAGSWYALTYKNTPPRDIIGRLQVSVLQNEVFDKILGITDPRTDKRIDFAGGIRGPEWLESLVNEGRMAAAFTIYPVTLDELLEVADAGLVMPPKSTWFEPKPRAGLFIHKFD